MRKLTFLGWYILIIFLFMCLLILLASCRSVQYVPVETVRTEYVSRTDTVHKTDTVTNNRETVIREVNKGDSALLARYGIQIKDNERMMLFLQRELERERSKEKEVMHDTVIVNDTVCVPYPVERQETTWEKLTENLGDKIMMILILIVLLALLRKRR